LNKEWATMASNPAGDARAEWDGRSGGKQARNAPGDLNDKLVVDSDEHRSPLRACQAKREFEREP
jgi:hypothetical protein